MKKFFLFFTIVLQCSFYIYTQPVYRITHNTNYLDYDYDHYEKVEAVEKDTKVYLGNNWGCLFSEVLVVYNLNKSIYRNISPFDIEPIETNSLFNENLITNNTNNFFWVPSYYFNVLLSTKSDDFINKYERHINKLENYSEYSLDMWKTDFYFFNYLVITNSLIGIGYGNNLSPQHTYDLNIVSIDETKFGYDVVVTNGESVIKRLKNKEIETEVLKNSWLLEKLPNYDDYIKYILLIRIDGDYLNIYLNSEDNLLQSFCKMNRKTQAEFYSLLKLKSVNYDYIDWPRHADGSCDYEPSNKQLASKTAPTAQPQNNVSLDKLMTASDNLRLRSAEETSSSIITTMQKGTSVKVIKLGKLETIDGITSNWVQIEVQSGKDRDDKTLKKGTIGWCFGGYLDPKP